MAESKGGIKKRNRAVFVILKGVRHKLCTGPAHPEGEFVPVTGFFMRGDGRLRPQCKQCESINRGTEPMIPYSEIRFAVEELIFRVGKVEASRRIGVKATTMYEWTRGKRKFVHRRSARAIVTALAEARSKNEARHRKSIKHGATMRGKQERIPRHPSDFNGKNDKGIEQGREHRRRASLTASG